MKNRYIRNIQEKVTQGNNCHNIKRDKRKDKHMFEKVNSRNKVQNKMSGEHCENTRCDTRAIQTEEHEDREGDKIRREARASRTKERTRKETNKVFYL